MTSEDLNKSLSESTRSLAKAFIILGFDTVDKMQKFGAQAQEFVQELVEEAKTEQAANKVSVENNTQNHYQDEEKSAIEIVEPAQQE